MGLVRLNINGKDLRLDLSSFNYKDEKGILSDSISLEVAGQWERPKYQDEIKAWIGDFYCGTFSVQNIRLSKFQTIIEATAINFSSSLKQKKNRSFSGNLKEICATIASEHNLKCKVDCEAQIPHISQINISDLEFLKNLSQNHNASFSIKNNTLLFLKNKKEDIKVSYEIDENECETWELRISNKTLYKSAKALWQDTKTASIQSVQIGLGEPTLILQENFKSPDEATAKTKAALELANKGTIKGSLSISGQIIEAGAKLKFKNQTFVISSVNHSINSNGYNLQVEFEN